MDCLDGLDWMQLLCRYVVVSVVGGDENEDEDEDKEKEQTIKREL